MMVKKEPVDAAAVRWLLGKLATAARSSRQLVPRTSLVVQAAGVEVDAANATNSPTPDTLPPLARVIALVQEIQSQS